jgi:SAM-dependent methyltransferase
VTQNYYFDPRVAQGYDGQPELPADDIPFYLGLAKEAVAGGGSVLELGCGTGRVTVPIARSGVDVTGLDDAAPMLEIARSKSRGVANVNWVEGDMRDFHLGQRFGLVIIPYRSFLLLLSAEDQLACLACIHDHLVVGGRLALNIFNPDLTIMGRRLALRRNALRRRPGRIDVASGHSLDRWEKSSYGTAGQTVDWTWRQEERGEQGAVISRVSKTLRLRYVFRYEMEHLLARSGFEVDALYGWFDKRPFGDESTEMVWVARRTENIGHRA